MNDVNFQNLIDKGNWNRDDLKQLLEIKGASQDYLFQKAVAVRKKYVGDTIVLRGVIEISSYCQKKCDYCSMRSGNKIPRYRMQADEIFNIAKQIKKDGIGTTFLQAGQERHSDLIIEEVVPRIKKELDMEILLNLGEKDPAVYKRYKDVGVDSYILKFESSDPELYQKTTHSLFSDRYECAQVLKKLGFRLGTGNIIGLPGQNLDHLVDDIELALKLKPNFVSSAPLIPSENTPFENAPHGSLNTTLNMIALLRILLKDVSIPAISALETLEKGGQLRGLNAGANILTINYTPVASQEKYGIYNDERYIVKFDHAKTISGQASLAWPQNQ